MPFFPNVTFQTSPSIRAVGEVLIYDENSNGVKDPEDYFVGFDHKRLDAIRQNQMTQWLCEKLVVGSIDGLKLTPAFLFLQELEHMKLSARAGDIEFVELHGKRASIFAAEGGFDLAVQLAIASARTVAQQACAKKPQCIVTNTEEKPKTLATFLPNPR